MVIFILLAILAGILCFVAYSIARGYLQAYYYHNRNLTRENLHWLYFLDAVIFAMLCSYLMLNKENIIKDLFIFSGNTMAFGLIFPYIHDGAYYLVRNILNPKIYKLKWRDYNDSTDSKHDFVYTDRLGMFIVGSLALVIINIFNII